MSLADTEVRWSPARSTGSGEAVVVGAPQSLGVAREAADRLCGALGMVLRLEPGQPTPRRGERVRYIGGPWPLRTAVVEVIR